VGWYEAGWGPMMSTVAHFVKDIVGPLGCISIADPAKASCKTDSADIDGHTKTNSLIKHHSELDADGNPVHDDEVINMEDEPKHQELCDREQSYFLKAIQENIDLTEHMNDAVNSLRIVLAADESIRTKKVVDL